MEPDQRKAEIYEGLLGLMMPPHPMTVAEFTEWWVRERAPAVKSMGLTIDEAAQALLMLADGYHEARPREQA